MLLDRKSTRLNSSHRCISYAVFCLKKKKKQKQKHIIDHAYTDTTSPTISALSHSTTFSSLMTVSSFLVGMFIAFCFFFFFLMIRRPPRFTLFPSTTLFRSVHARFGNPPAKPAVSLCHRVREEVL